MGGALLQQIDRDTQRFAMKCSAMSRTVGALDKTEWFPVQKDPVTDSGKRSKAGRVTLMSRRTLGQREFYSGVEDWTPSALVEVYRDGQLVTEYTFDQVRENASYG
jgi:nicotinamide phosphoribosyltransferase